MKKKIEITRLLLGFLGYLTCDALAPRPGLEPGTISLTGSRSTIELSRNNI